MAICHHRPPRTEGEVAVRLVRERDERGETTMRVREQTAFGSMGMPTRSVYRLDAYNNDLSKVEVLLETGKTHQIRVHLAHIGAPVVGDIRYGNAELDKALFARKSGVEQRLYLHALKIELPEIHNNKKIVIKAPLPAEFGEIMRENV
jgi:23S rRNA-/tRNA-specific pseudouridylate synthase